MAKILNFSLYVILTYLVSHGSKAIEMLGPAEMVINYVGFCENHEKYPYQVYATRIKFNRTHYSFSANVTVDFDVNDDITLYVNIAKWGDGGYKPNAYIVDEKNPCEYFMKWSNDAFHLFLRAMNKPEECPMKAGTYIMDNYVISLQLPPALVYGNFKSNLYFRRGNVDLGCLEMKCDIKPKSALG